MARVCCGHGTGRVWRVPARTPMSAQPPWKDSMGERDWLGARGGCDAADRLPPAMSPAQPFNARHSTTPSLRHTALPRAWRTAGQLLPHISDALILSASSHSSKERIYKILRCSSWPGRGAATVAFHSSMSASHPTKLERRLQSAWCWARPSSAHARACWQRVLGRTRGTRPLTRQLAQAEPRQEW